MGREKELKSKLDAAKSRSLSTDDDKLHKKLKKNKDRSKDKEKREVKLESKDKVRDKERKDKHRDKDKERERKRKKGENKQSCRPGKDKRGWKVPPTVMAVTTPVMVMRENSALLMSRSLMKTILYISQCMIR